MTSRIHNISLAIGTVSLLAMGVALSFISVPMREAFVTDHDTAGIGITMIALMVSAVGLGISLLAGITCYITIYVRKDQFKNESILFPIWRIALILPALITAILLLLILYA